LEIELRQAAGVMGGQDNVHFVVNVRPLRMMVELFRRQRHPRHEAEGLVEIAEREAAFDGVSRTRELPAVESGQRLFRLRPVQLLSCHGCSPCLSARKGRITRLSCQKLDRAEAEKALAGLDG